MLHSPELLKEEMKELSQHSFSSIPGVHWLKNSEKKSSQRFTFVRTAQKEECKQEEVVENRKRIKDGLMLKLGIIISKTEITISDNLDTNTDNFQDQFLKTSRAINIKLENISRKLDLDLQYFQSDKISLNVMDYLNVYEVLDVLGEGCIGLVKRIRNKKTGEYFAVKMVATQEEEIIRNIVIEFNSLLKVNHDNIVKVYELYIDYNDGFQSESQAYVEMFEVITDIGHYSEEHAKVLFKQLLSAIECMHRQGICHRDLKPHNILCQKGTNILKVTDFNVSKFSEDYKDLGSLKDSQNIEMWTYTGTVAFSAPEIFTGEGYTQMVDMWSAGCILYSMLSGQLPFNAEYLNDLVEVIQKAEFSFPSEQFDSVSLEAIDLIKKLLQKNPSDRLYPDQALEHQWFVEPGPQHKRKTLKALHLKENMQHLTSRTFNKEKKIIFLKQMMGKNSQHEIFIKPPLTTHNSFTNNHQKLGKPCNITKTSSLHNLFENPDATKQYVKSRFVKMTLVEQTIGLNDKDEQEVLDEEQAVFTAGQKQSSISEFP